MKNFSSARARQHCRLSSRPPRTASPTTITKHGRPAAVVISHREWTKLKTRDRRASQVSGTKS
ncbi:MAG: type II toxin-antitoxin system prevent-host-death family antitoxin [Alphaproteobacteria bacterium]|nr:MAG: type II toxin-antitoxin system prevent-host-death family antitoxin [Alphaproteobacteria bacterium]TMK44259.1 MAG: type II toxin-antitoxin system prevent-host-death family antitoxin [Alphaproteobacteria bacterium]